MNINGKAAGEQVRQFDIKRGERFAIHHVAQWILDRAGHGTLTHVDMCWLGNARRAGFDAE